MRGVGRTKTEGLNPKRECRRAWEFDLKAEPRQGVAEGEKEYTVAVAERLASWSNTEKAITPNGGRR